MRRLAGLLSVVAMTLAPSAANATWSIAAVDPETQQVGVAVASCVEAPFGSTILPEVAGLAPGWGALAAQAVYSQQRRDQAVALLLNGASPQAVIDGALAGDGEAQLRQYGVVTLDGQTATFTGSSTQAWAGDQMGMTATAQGNILYRPEVVSDALAAFESRAPRCPFTLADRLMLALEAGAAQGGDTRCSERQSALAATLRVAWPGDAPGAPSLDLRIPSQPEGGDNPVALLRAEYDQWRLRNPPDTSGCAPGSTGTGVGASTNAGGADESGAAGSTGQPAASTGAPSTTMTTGPVTLSTGANAPDTKSGCGCRTSAPPAGLLGLLALGFRRRKWRKSTSWRRSG